MGQVYLGRSPGGRQVAIKVIRSEYAADSTFRKRFHREVAAIRRVPGIFTAPVMDADPDGSPPWLATAYLDAPSLQERVRRSGPLPAGEVLSLARSLAEALSSVHAEGLTHRDLKPSNVLLGVDGPKLIDFGLAVAAEATVITGTRLIGTPAYMSPEQCRGGRVEQPSDVFSFGGLLVYAATGRAAFGTGAVHELVYRIVHGEPDLDGLDAALREIVGHCLRKDPAARPSAARLLSRLTEIVTTEPKAAGAAGGSGEGDKDAFGAAGSASLAAPPVRVGQAGPNAANRPQPTLLYTQPFGAPITPKPRPSGGPPAGIDLGTGNAVICVLEGGEPIVVAGGEGAGSTPSIVTFAVTGEVLVGEPARRLDTRRHRYRTVRSVTRGLGGAPGIEIDGRALSPQQLCAFLLYRLKRDAENYLGERVVDVVITVPACCSAAYRQAVKEAAVIAGLNVSRLISAPDAAGLAYAQHWPAQHDEATVLVVDLGAGTLGMSLLDLGDGIVLVRAIAGDDRLGGDDWDGRIVQWLVRRFIETHGVDLSNDSSALEDLSRVAERARIELSHDTETLITVPVHLPGAAQGNRLNLEATLTRVEFQALTADLVERCRAPFHQVLKDAGVAPADLNRVVLVGGAGRMPAIADLFRELTGGREPYRDIDPDKAAAVGAALQAGVIKGQVNLLAIQTAARSLGVETEGGAFTKIIYRTDNLPVKRSETFFLGRASIVDGHDGKIDLASLVGKSRDQVREVLEHAKHARRIGQIASLPMRGERPGTAEIHVYRGEHEIATDNERIGTIVLTGLPATETGTLEVTVTFELDVSGLHFSVENAATGERLPTIAFANAALRPDELDRMVEEMQEHIDEVWRREEEAEVRKLAEALAESAQQSIRRHSERIPQELITEAHAALSVVKTALAHTDMSDIRTAWERLSTAAQNLDAALYSQNQAREETQRSHAEHDD